MDVLDEDRPGRTGDAWPGSGGPGWVSVPATRTVPRPPGPLPRQRVPADRRPGLLGRSSRPRSGHPGIGRLSSAIRDRIRVPDHEPVLDLDSEPLSSRLIGLLRDQRGWRRPRLLALSATALVLALAAIVGTASSGEAAPAGGGPVWVSAPRSATAASPVEDILKRRAEAVRTRDKAAFMADVDTVDSTFARRQETMYENLIRMPFVELSYQLEPSVSYRRQVPEGTARRFHTAVYAPGVTLRYRIQDVDSNVVTSPWVPIFGYTGDRWVLADEVADNGLPYGTNGQAWDAGSIWLARSNRVTAVFSADDTSRADYLLRLAERGLDKVVALRPTGWDGKVFVTAVQDQRIFDAYFRSAPDRIAQVAAIAVQYYAQVPEWHKDAPFATTRVVFNPQQLSAQPEELAHDLAHEFTHAAMGPVTTASTPRWLVEGFAEYGAYRGDDLEAAAVRKRIREAEIGGALPADADFYSKSSNYVASWLACRLIAERYGEKRLVALYEAFGHQSDQAAVVQSVLGVDLPTLVAQWQAYVAKARTP